MILWPLIIALVASGSHARAERTDALAHAVLGLHVRELDLEEAYEHVEAALEAERPGVPAELLLAVAATETRFTARARSRGGRYCGVLQATRDRDGWTCAELLELRVGYRAGALSLARWMKARRGNLRRALHGYGGVVVNGSTSYPDRVLRRLERIRRFVAAWGMASW